jgi:putative copper export protein
MTEQRQRREVFANPFFVLLMGTSVLFVLTVLAYLVSPYVLAPRADRPPRGAGSLAMAEWLDRNAPLILAIEIVVMLAAGVLAMATDSWFSPRSRPKPRS